MDISSLVMLNSLTVVQLLPARRSVEPVDVGEARLSEPVLGFRAILLGLWAWRRRRLRESSIGLEHVAPIVRLFFLLLLLPFTNFPSFRLARPSFLQGWMCLLF
eukprot:Rhum_TRINITY_DN14709_c14_g1::Rhum_TRINITY_DN14709_c14_g1_i1::g.110774::m.110774